MTTLTSRDFVAGAEPEFFSRGEGRGFLNCEAMNADAIGIGAVPLGGTGVDSWGDSALRSQSLPAISFLFPI